MSLVPRPDGVKWLRLSPPPLTAEQEARVRTLSKTVVSRIDASLVASASPRWRKVATVVAAALGEARGSAAGLPDVYYAQRVRELVAAGRLESFGDLCRMRYSEVRLPGYHRGEV
ncbi:MAG: hypothetical protein E6K27_00425 [Gammaproteobacteria bacterium]|nr:MAG: hypothetical protein E6K27_00425 [Gammaproteobacteria bacterium]